ncbi:MAG: hypothetical protein ABIF40_04650 [archaeon]
MKIQNKNKLIWNILILTILTTSVVSAEEYLIETKTKSIGLVLTLNEDGSVLSEVELLTKLEEIPEEYEENIITLTYKVSNKKLIKDVEIVDLKEPSLPPFIKTSKLNQSNCSRQYSIDFKTNIIKICSPFSSEKELLHKITYTYLQELTCKEFERVKQDIPIFIRSREEPYSVRITTQANEKVDYVAPKNCPDGWVKSSQPNGIICINDEFTTGDPKYGLQLTFPLTGDVKKKIDETELNKEKYKEIIGSILLVVLAILTYLGFQDFINSRFTEHPIIFTIIALILLFIYILYLLW